MEVKHQVKESIKNGLAISELLLLKFSKTEAQNLKWEHDEEFEYHGEMYDVIQMHESADSIGYLVWHDKKESKINRLISETFRQGFRTDAKKAETQKRFNFYFQLLYFHASTAEYSSIPTSKNLLNTSMSTIYKLDVFSPQVPPPEKLV